MRVIVYSPLRKGSIFRLFREIIRGFIDGRELAWRLFVRDLKASYRKSFLGIFWLFLPPLATAGIWIFLNSQKIVAIQETPMAYTGFALCGTMLWSLFAEAISKPIQRYQGAMTMMGKLNFPREAIVLASFYDLAFSLFLKSVILIPVLWILGYPPEWQFISGLFFIFLLMLSGLSLGIFLSPLGLLYSDIGKALPIVLPFAMYLTPVIYPLRTGGPLAMLQGLNPVTPFLERARSLLGGYAFDMQSELLWWSLGTVLILILGMMAIRIALPIIVERAGS
ncbi:MAG: polysialic acid transporter [Marivirga sp.]|nr:polysialic acid transporter [Marivirga sp.]